MPNGYTVSTQGNPLLNCNLLRDTENRLWFFYLTPARSIKYGTSEDEGINWSNPMELTGKTNGPFTVMLDENNGIHVAAVQEYKKVIYLHLDESGWSKHLLSWNGEAIQPFYPIVHIDRQGTLHIAYGVRSTTGKWSVRHYRFRRGEPAIERTEFTVPFAVDLCANFFSKKQQALKYTSFLCGDVDSDTKGNLHLVHRYYDGRYFQLYYNFFDREKEQWESPRPLSSFNSNCSIPTMLVDYRDELHLLWPASMEDRHKLCYQKKSSQWQSRIVLRKDGQPKISPVLLQRNDEILACWYENGLLYLTSPGGDKNNNFQHRFLCPGNAKIIKIISHRKGNNGFDRKLPITLVLAEGKNLLFYIENVLHTTERLTGTEVQVASHGEVFAPDFTEPGPTQDSCLKSDREQSGMGKKDGIKPERELSGETVENLQTLRKRKIIDWKF